MPDDNHQPEVPNEVTPDVSSESEVYSSTSQPYGAETTTAVTVAPAASASVPAVILPPPPPPPPPKKDDDDDDDPEEKGMLRMSFMEHLEELRARLLRSVLGIIAAFVLSITFCKPLWHVVSEPAVQALTHLGVHPPNLVAISPMEQFNVIYLKLPLLMSVFVGSPWVLYQVWAFISPGLYKREKRWAVPFVVSTAGLFISGGCFAYFVAFRFGLEFLLGIGRDVNVSSMVSIDQYFDLFVNVTLGVGLVFEMPVIIFFLTLLRLASPRFLIRHSRYAILGITVLAAVVTPTPDVFNMMIFAVPMVLLFFIGVFASYLLVLRREGKGFPWKIVSLLVLGLIAMTAGTLAIFIYHLHYHFIPYWPFLIK
jgi:sec-independent protein translocase protein TatC